MQRQRGYSLIEIMIALVIALFLLAGLGSMVSGTRKTSTNQVSMAMLQDQERLAMSMLNDVIQTTGYFDTATYWSTSAAFNTSVTTTGFPTNVTLAAGQTISGTHNTNLTTPDVIAVRYGSTGTDGVFNCTGVSSAGASTNVFYVNTTASANQLMCSPDGTQANAIVLVDNVVNLQAYYGVSTVAGACNAAGVTCNVDTYMTANNVGALWPNVVSVRVTVTFVNPLAKVNGVAQAGQPPYVYFTRVISLQGRTI